MQDDIQPMHAYCRPLVNGKTIGNYQGKEVTLIGRVVDTVNNQDVVSLETSDKHSITVFLTGPVQYNSDDILMVRGQPNGDTSLTQNPNDPYSCVKLDSESPFDMDAFDQFIVLAEKNFREMFWE
ncbi:hypothetical protein ABK040_007383 [Willaertia magna]